MIRQVEIKYIRILLLISCMIYFLSTCIGFFAGPYLQLNPIALSLSTNPYTYIIHNFKSMVFFISGLFTMEISTMYVLFMNGFVLGASLYGIGTSSTFFSAFIRIIPHGIFEIPAMILGEVIGLYSIQVFVRFLKGGKLLEIKDFKLVLKLLSLVVILLICAGIVEAYITPYFIKQ